ncbi:MAG: glycosyl hydrolase family 65 protein [Aquisalimonadaceae bacterium]
MRNRSNQQQTFALEPWRITETGFDTESNFLDETLFALGNGYVGLRGTHEEGYNGPAGTSLDGTYLNGFYESEPIHYPEGAYGLARRNQFMLNAPNGKRIELSIEGERFDLLQGRVLKYERSLDFRTGVLTRLVEWMSPQGRHIAVTSQRLVSFNDKHLFAIRYSVEPLNFSGRIQLLSALDGQVKNLEVGDDPRAGSAYSGAALQLIDLEQTDAFCALVHRTRNSGFNLVSAIESELKDGNGQTVDRETVTHDQRVEQWYDVFATEGKPVCLTKFGCYFSSRDYPEAELLPRAKQVLGVARTAGFDTLCTSQAEYLQAFWQQADVEIAGDDALQQGIRFNQFHLLQSVGRDGKTNIAAKGVTGEGYEGHYFWDTEIYVFPFFLYTKPDIARKLLEFRCGSLPKARERARQLAHAKGALYPWRTIDGDECSSYFPAGTAQYHINADIAYSVKQYVEVTGDEAFLVHAGAEMVMETARIWMGIGGYIDNKGGRFCINEVTGPDEYTALVNNNYYTNTLAQLHLQYAADVADMLRDRYPAEFKSLARAIDLEDDEPARWWRAAEHMYLPYDEGLGIHPQDDSFLSKVVWDFAATPEQNYPLLLHYHPLVIYRHQVCKQADVVLALLLRGNRFSLDQKMRDFDYYEAITTHDSSLSSCIFSIIASEIGYRDKAYGYFMETARLDLDNTHANTQYGVHTAAMAGTWMGMVHGFAGMRVYDGSLSFSPYLPEQWRHYQFKVRIQGRLLHVHVKQDQAEYRLLEGDSITFRHQAQAIRLTPDQPAQTAGIAPLNTDQTALGLQTAAE